MATKSKGGPEIHGAVSFNGVVYGPDKAEELQEAIDAADEAADEAEGSDEAEPVARFDVERLTEMGVISGFKGGGKNPKKLRRYIRTRERGNPLQPISRRRAEYHEDGIVSEMEAMDEEQRQKAVEKAAGAQEGEASEEGESAPKSSKSGSKKSGSKKSQK